MVIQPVNRAGDDENNQFDECDYRDELKPADARTEAQADRAAIVLIAGLRDSLVFRIQVGLEPEKVIFFVIL